MKLGPIEKFNPNNPEHLDPKKYKITYKSSGRKPTSVQIEMSFKEDAKRRDFTFNAMAIDSKGNVIDYFDGQQAIQSKILKTVGDPEQRFTEDYLRMMRAIRFASRLGFNIDPQTGEAIKKHATKISGISSERILKELLSMAEQSGSKFADAIIGLNDFGLLQHILPEIVSMDEYEHDEETHPEGNVYQHTLAALRANGIVDPIINLAILLHDIGKTTTRTYKDNGKVQYLGHAQAGISLIEKIANRLKMDNDAKDALIFAAENHMKMHNLLNMSNAKIYALIKNKNWNVLYNVALADQKARGNLFQKADWDKTVERIEDVTNKYANQDFQKAIKKVLNGEMVMQLKGLKPGPEVGKIINQTMDWILNKNIDINDIEKIKRYIISI
jgi:tRNA nucleotidyltransferase/poly(A) polymerase